MTYSDMWIEGRDEPMLVCSDCGSMVHPDLTEEHDTLHPVFDGAVWDYLARVAELGLGDEIPEFAGMTGLGALQVALAQAFRELAGKLR